MLSIKNKSFNEIRNFYNKLDDFNNSKNHFINSNDICTPLDCVKEMVDKIPNKFWERKDIKILDSCCGNGNFFAYIQKKTKLENLYFNEINHKRLENVKEIFGKNINLTEKDFLEFEEKEEYDLVVSNPPYAKFSNGKRTSKNHNMSRDFIEKAVKITKKNGYILFIVPNNWMSYADRNKLPKILSQYQFLHLNINGAKKWFPKVGSSFTWFLLQKKENEESFIIENNYILKDVEIVKIDKSIDYIPLYYSNVVKSIIDKTLNLNCEKYKIETSSNLHKFTKRDLIGDVKNEKFKYKLIHTPSQIVYSEIPHKFQKGYKVFISLSNQYKIFIDNCGMTQSVAFIRCSSKKEAERIKDELDNEIFKFLNNITRYGNFNNVRILQSFPLLKNIKLNKKEIKLIKEFNKKYYNNKDNNLNNWLR